MARPESRTRDRRPGKLASRVGIQWGFTADPGSGRRQRAEEEVDRRVVAHVPRVVCEPDATVGADDKGTGHPEHVTRRGAGQVPAKRRPDRPGDHRRPEELREPPAAEAERGVGAPGRVGQEREVRPERRLRPRGPRRVGRADRRQPRVPPAELLPPLPQLAELLLAERSAEVAQEDERRERPLPERAERDLAAGRVEHGGRGRRVACGELSAEHVRLPT